MWLCSQPAVGGEGLGLGVAHGRWDPTRLELDEDKWDVGGRSVGGEGLAPVRDQCGLKALVVVGLAAVLLALVP